MSLEFSVVPSPEGAEVLAFGMGTDLEPVGPGVTPGEVDAGFLRATGFRGKVGETQWLAAPGRALLAVGIGDPSELSVDDLRRAAAAAARAASQVPTLYTTLHHAATATATLVSDARPAAATPEPDPGPVIEGMDLASYHYQTNRTNGNDSDSPPRLAQVVLVGATSAQVVPAQVRATATIRARDWVNRPPGDLRPRRFAEEAAEAGAAAGLEVEVWDEERIAAEGLGCLAGVAAGSSEPPRLVRLTYRPAGTPTGHLALVGKGITFDSGGLSLKPPASMETMKSDMGGAAAVLSALLALPALAPSVRVDGWAAMAENMPSGDAIRPGDVLTAKNGTTVEVLNTDAEGRLVLADALLVAGEANPDVIVDIATLTGGQRIALGSQVAGVLGTDAAVAAVIAAGERAGEPAWRLPLWQGYRSKLESNVADLRNVSTDGAASTIMAALFLQRFVGERAWAHLDIAAPSFVDKAQGWLSKGATGWGTRTLIELVTVWS